MFLAPVHRTHVDAAARGEGLCSRRGMDITNLQGCLTFVIYPVTIAVDEAVIAGSANRIETGEIIVPGGTLAALSTTLHDSYLSIHWTLSAGYCAFDPAASSPVGAVTLLGESAGLQSFFGGEITDPLEFNAWLSKQCGESSHLMMLGELDGCHIVAEDCLGFPPGFRRSPLTSRPLGQKGTFLGSNDTLSTGSEGNIRTVDFSDDAPGLEFILTSPPAVAAGFEPSDRQSPLTSRPLGQKVILVKYLVHLPPCSAFCCLSGELLSWESSATYSAGAGRVAEYGLSGFAVRTAVRPSRPRIRIRRIVIIPGRGTMSEVADACP